MTFWKMKKVGFQKYGYIVSECWIPRVFAAIRGVLWFECSVDLRTDLANIWGQFSNVQVTSWPMTTKASMPTPPSTSRSGTVKNTRMFWNGKNVSEHVLNENVLEKSRKCESEKNIRRWCHTVPYLSRGMCPDHWILVLNSSSEPEKSRIRIFWEILENEKNK